MARPVKKLTIQALIRCLRLTPPPPLPRFPHALLSNGLDAGGYRERPGTDLEAHPRAHIGPDTHTFKAEEVEVVNQAREEEKADGSNASLSAQMEHR